jgi:predicted lipoprotein with Yx(FWY)xxD motif
MRFPGTVATALLVAVAGCGGSSAAPVRRSADPPRSAPVAAPKPRPKPAGQVVEASRSAYGRILFDGHGRALYLFTHDTGAGSRCSAACAAAWPPFLSRSAPRAGRGAKQSLLATTRRGDGSRQVTYAGHPLYYYVGDARPGQVGCQAALEYGGYWYVVRSDGRALS